MNEIEFLDNLLVYNTKYSVTFINQTLQNYNLDGLRIFSAFEEDKIDDFSFLKDIVGLNELSFFYFEKVDFSFLYELKKLKKLNIQTLFSEIDFCKLTHLDSVGIHWNNTNIKNLSSLVNISYLFIYGFDENNLTKLRFFKNLKFLSLKDSKCSSLEGIENLLNLNGLLLGSFKSLLDISNLASLQKLKYLYFDGCPKIIDFSTLSNLKTLEILELIDCKKIKDILFLKSLYNIIQFSVLGKCEVENIDLLFNKNIERVYMKNYKSNNTIIGKRISFLNLVQQK